MDEIVMAEVRVVRDITNTLVKSTRKRQLRPGIKALFYDSHLGEVLMGTLPEGYPLRFNLPGGGIDPGQSAATALCREIGEELGITTYTSRTVASLPVVAHGELPFEREGFRGKYEFIVAVPHRQLDTIKAMPNSKMLLWPAMSWQEAIEKVRTLRYGGPEMGVLYEQALRSIPQLLDR